MNVPPDSDDIAYRAIKIICATGQGSGVDGTGRGAGDDRKRVGLAPCTRGLSDVGDGFQHPDLVGGAGAAAGKQ